MYSLLEQGGYDVKLDTPVSIDEAGNQCEEDKCFGKPVEFTFTLNHILSSVLTSVVPTPTCPTTDYLEETRGCNPNEGNQCLSSGLHW